MVTKKPRHLPASFPSISAWVRGHGWIEIGQQEDVGFITRALDDGDVVYEDGACRTLDDAMRSLEKGIAELIHRDEGYSSSASSENGRAS